jgi:hypothetical protein
MDRGLLQKQKALEVKRVLRHIKSGKFKCQSIESVQYMRAQSDPGAATEASSSHVLVLSLIYGNGTGVVCGFA